MTLPLHMLDIIILSIGCLIILCLIPCSGRYIYLFWKYRDHLFIRKRRPTQIILISVILLLFVTLILPIWLYHLLSSKYLYNQSFSPFLLSLSFSVIDLFLYTISLRIWYLYYDFISVKNLLEYKWAFLMLESPETPNDIQSSIKQPWTIQYHHYFANWKKIFAALYTFLFIVYGSIYALHYQFSIPLVLMKAIHTLLLLPYALLIYFVYNKLRTEELLKADSILLVQEIKMHHILSIIVIISLILVDVVEVLFVYYAPNNMYNIYIVFDDRNINMVNTLNILVLLIVYCIHYIILTFWIFNKKQKFTKKLKITYKQFNNTFNDFHMNGMPNSGSNKTTIEFIAMSPCDITKHRRASTSRSTHRSKSRHSANKKGHNVVARHVPFNQVISNERGFKLFADHLVRELAVESLLFIYHFMQIKYKLLQYRMVSRDEIGLLLPMPNEILAKSTSHLISPGLRPVAGNEFTVSFGAGNNTPQAEGMVDAKARFSFADLTPRNSANLERDSLRRTSSLRKQLSLSKSGTADKNGGGHQSVMDLVDAALSTPKSRSSGTGNQINNLQLNISVHSDKLPPVTEEADNYTPDSPIPETLKEQQRTNHKLQITVTSVKNNKSEQKVEENNDEQTVLAQPTSFAMSMKQKPKKLGVLDLSPSSATRSSEEYDSPSGSDSPMNAPEASPSLSSPVASPRSLQDDEKEQEHGQQPQKLQIMVTPVAEHPTQESNDGARSPNEARNPFNIAVHKKPKQRGHGQADRSPSSDEYDSPSGTESPSNAEAVEFCKDSPTPSLPPKQQDHHAQETPDEAQQQRYVIMDILDDDDEELQPVETPKYTKLDLAIANSGASSTVPHGTLSDENSVQLQIDLPATDSMRASANRASAVASQHSLSKQVSFNTRIPIFDTYSCFRMLFDRYILAESVMSVNIDHECRMHLMDTFTALQLYYDQDTEPKQPVEYGIATITNDWDIHDYITIFDEAASQVYRLLSSDPFIRFTATEV